MQHVKDPLLWDDVRLFLALCRSPTAGKAARALGVNTSTVSRRLTQLEERLNTVLFSRSRAGMAMTLSAEHLLPRAEAIELGIAEFANEVDRLERDIQGEVRVTSPPDVAAVAVAPMLPALLNAHPDLRINLDAGEQILDLNRREADIALRVIRPTGGDLVMTRVATVRWVAVGSAAFVKQHGTVKKWGNVPWIGAGKQLSRMPAAQWFASVAPDVEPAVTSNSLNTQIAAAIEGCGAVLLPAPSVKHYGLVPLKLGRALKPEADQLPTDDLFLVSHRAMRHVPRVRVVWEALQSHLRDVFESAGG